MFILLSRTNKSWLYSQCCLRISSSSGSRCIWWQYIWNTSWFWFSKCTTTKYAELYISGNLINIIIHQFESENKMFTNLYVIVNISVRLLKKIDIIIKSSMNYYFFFFSKFQPKLFLNYLPFYYN